MNPKNKQKISIFLYLLLSTLLFTGVLFLGRHFIEDNTIPVTDGTEPVPETQTDSPDSEHSETEPETVVINESESVDLLESDETETSAEKARLETESQTEADLPLTETKPAEEEKSAESSADPAESAETSEEPDDPIERLMLLFEKRAPLRWARVYSVNENGETESHFEKVYPKLAYFYMDLETGQSVTYNADEILYSASLIKAPYIFAVLEEIDNFEKTKLSQTDETDTDEIQPETEIPVISEIEELPETEAEEETMLTEPDSVQTEETDSGIIYLEGEEKYNLDEIWTFDPATMMEEGSGEIMDMPAGVEMTWRELVEYALLYSDNIAFAQLRQRFGYTSFYTKAAELGIRGVMTDFMNLSARDCALFLEDMYAYFETGSANAEMMRGCMAKSKHLEMIAAHYPEGTAAHKYGWDLGAFHDMAILYDEHPYVLVIMTDYEDGGEEPTDFMGDVVALTKEIHASVHPEKEENETEESEMSPAAPTADESKS